MPDGTATDFITPGLNDRFYAQRGSDNDLVRVRPEDIPAGAPFGGANVADAILKQENYQFTSCTYDADQVIVSGNVLWSDGSAGVFTTTEIDATHFLINAYTVTHVDSGKTVTQPAVTRDSDGNATTIPAKTVA